MVFKLSVRVTFQLNNVCKPQRNDVVSAVAEVFCEDLHQTIVNTAKSLDAPLRFLN